MEERRLRRTQPVGRLLEEFLAVAYKAHPYGEPVIGHMSDLQTVTREEAEEFFRKYYVPSNMIVAIVGDVQPARVKELAEAVWPHSRQARTGGGRDRRTKADWRTTRCDKRSRPAFRSGRLSQTGH